MDWRRIRQTLGRVTHQTFSEPATYTPPVAGDGDSEPRAVTGILREATTVERATDELEYEARNTEYEIRKGAEGGWKVDDFAEQGQLALHDGDTYTVIYVTQDDLYIRLGLAANEE